MDFKTFFIKKVMMSFFVSITCISAAMAVIGMIFEPNTRFGYEVFLSPFFFGALASLPLLVKYSKKELSFKQTVIRNVIHFVLLEVGIMSFLYFGEMLTSISKAISLGVSIFIIDLTVYLVLWMNDERTAKEFNNALKRLQNDYGADE
ncbi:MAG: hypothetical protein K0R15_2807 [Clostridiales bacterium]|jgi:hypothetical protein|nr:hypothetical protein [Clostridiales bacterium]